MDCLFLIAPDDSQKNKSALKRHPIGRDHGTKQKSSIVRWREGEMEIGDDTTAI